MNPTLTQKKEKEVTLFGTNDDKLIEYPQRKVDRKIKLPMFKINRKFVNMPLPAHMAGPMRPYAIEYINREKKQRRKSKGL